MTTIKSKNPAISKWVKSARKSKGLTQKDLAVKLKISKRSLENYESGEVDVPSATAMGVAKICEYPPDFFGTGEGQSIEEEGRKADTDSNTKDRYIALLEKTVGKLEKENKELKAQTKKSTAKPRTARKK
jgi:transcriptional regulator with XRE-family HTH domain